MARLTLKSQGELASFLSAGKAEIRSLKVHFTPKQEGTGDPSPENVRPIAGWTGVEAEKRGKNLVDVQDMEATYPWSTGTYKSYRLFIGANKTVTISYSSTLTGGYDFYFVIGSNYEQRNSSTGTWMYHKNVGSYIKRNMTVTTDDNGYIYLKLYVLNDAGLQDFYKYILDANFQVEYGTEVTSYEPYTGTTYTLDWTSDLGTLYGGYVDLISGEVVEEWGIIASYNGEAIPGEWLSDRDVYASGTTPTTGAQVAYELATPITHQLTPTEIQTFTGQNNFWSSADSIEVEYDLIETRDTWMYRRHMFALSSPHTESLTGTTLQFKADMANRLKQCRIHFTPIQEGTGDPSPENVMEISGWTGVSVTGCGKNLCPAATGVEMKSWVYSNYNRTLTLEGLAPGVPYTLSCTITEATGTSTQKRLYLVGASFTFINTGTSGEKSITVNSTDDGTITIRHQYNGLNAVADYITDIQLELGSTATAYEPYTGTTYTLDWTSDLGTLYGGYVDLISGEVVEEWGIIASYNGEAIPGEWLSDRDVYASGTTPTTGAQVAYELATPITHQLTPTDYPLDPVTIRTLRGLNNIWSDANGNIEIKYWTH